MHLNFLSVRSPHPRSTLLQAAFTLMLALPLSIFPDAAQAAIADFEVVMKNGATVTDRYTTTRQERNISLFVTQNRYPIRVQARTCRGQTLGPWITVRSDQLRHQPRIRRFWIVVARNVPDRTCFRLHFVSQTRTRPFIVSGRIRY